MMSGLFDNPSGLHMPAVETLVRLRATMKTDPYNPATHVDDWSQPDQAELQGFISSSSSIRTTDRLDTTTESDAVLTCPDPDADIRVGDIIHPKDDPSRRWKVIGIPARDRNPFTGWRPTLEARLREVKG